MNSKPWHLYLTPSLSHEARLVLGDNADHRNARFFCGDEGGYFIVTLTSEEKFSLCVNGQPVEPFREMRIDAGAIVSIEGIQYYAEIKLEDHTLTPPDMGTTPLFTQTAYALHPGQRDEQQDALGFAQSPDGTQYLWVIADGVTNGYDGAFASRYAVASVLLDFFNTGGRVRDRLVKSIVKAGDQLCALGDRLTAHKKSPTPVRCCTTLAAAALVRENKRTTWNFALVGDSHIYVYNAYHHLTLFEAEGHNAGNDLLVYALGKPGLNEEVVTFRQYIPTNTDWLLLTTDGVHAPLHFGVLQNCFQDIMNQPDNWDCIPDSLIKLALQAPGSGDNASVVLAQIVLHPPTQEREACANSAQVIIGVPPAPPSLPEPTPNRSLLDLFRRKKG